MMTTPGSALTGLKRQRPEWQPWLAVVEEALHEAATTKWDADVPAAVNGRERSHPLLAGAALTLSEAPVRRFMERLVRIAARGGTSKMASLEAAVDADMDMLTLFRASVCQDSELVDRVAELASVDAEALQAVAALLPVPLLHACSRRWASSASPAWEQGYCPCCGSWPAFAEVRGIERSRYFRCGRCGGEWHAHALTCPYCTTRDHNALVSLVPEQDGIGAVIEACTQCRGYVKSFTRLQGCAPGAVMIEDLASVGLDVAVLEQGYTRPAGPGYALDARVTAAEPRRGLFAWTSHEAR
jgi:FdhE protein